MQSSGIKVICKRCGRSSPAEEFVLDNIYGMMVCPPCVRDRQSKAASELKVKKEEVKQAIPEIKTEKRQPEIDFTKPKDWDHDDDFLSKAQKTKLAGMVNVQQIDHEKVKYKCPGCNFQFTYNLLKRTPARCPYCSDTIKKFKIA